ncbi:MAG: S9 family peptidase [Chloroflexota bacterium]
MPKIKKPYGLWSSPISPEMLGDKLKFTDVQWDTASNTIVWAERRGKRTVLVAKSGQDAMRDLTDSRFSPSGRVGYGGGAFTVHDGIVYFVDKGRLYRLSLAGGLPKAITPQFGGASSPRVSPDGKWIVFVHTYEHDDVLAIVDSEGKYFPQKIASGDDFVMQPAWSPEGNQIAYIAWNHPQMPWNGTELRLITLNLEGAVPYPIEEKTLTGNTEIAIAQPEFSPNGQYLSYISDESGWLHLYLMNRATGEHQQITTGEIEHGIPQWIQGNHTHAWTADSSNIAYIRHKNAFYSVWSYNVKNQTHHDSGLGEFGYTHWDFISVKPDSYGDIVAVTSSSVIAPHIVTYGEDGLQVMRRSITESLNSEQLSSVEAIEWVGHDGEVVHGLYFAPQSDTFEGIGLPPLMVMIHGGPTSQRNATFDMEVQYFTSRGFAVLQVNHRGSTGYGKAYMNKHQGNWGVYDVQDSITGAQHLIDKGLINGDKVVIMGGSAGGYTALQALVDAPNFFKAGVVSYGIANQFSLVMDTHKFEERYSDWLLGELPASAEKYRDRSPLFHAHKIQDALLIFQGTDDTVVPKNQSDAIVSALQRNGVPHEYVIYEGEGHGFRDPANIVDFYNRTLKFLKQYVIYS